MAKLDEQLRSIGLSVDECIRFKEMLNKAVFHRSEHWKKKSPEDQEVWAYEMALLTRECGIDRVDAGIENAWTHEGYLASASEVRRYLPPEVPESCIGPDPDCRRCHGNGYFEVEAQTVMWQGNWISVQELYGKPSMPAARRCDCESAAPARKKPEGVKEPIPWKKQA